MARMFFYTVYIMFVDRSIRFTGIEALSARCAHKQALREFEAKYGWKPRFKDAKVTLDDLECNEILVEEDELRRQSHLFDLMSRKIKFADSGLRNRHPCWPRCTDWTTSWKMHRKTQYRVR